MYSYSVLYDEIFLKLGSFFKAHPQWTDPGVILVKWLPATALWAGLGPKPQSRNAGHCPNAGTGIMVNANLDRHVIGI